MKHTRPGKGIISHNYEILRHGIHVPENIFVEYCQDKTLTRQETSTCYLITYEASNRSLRLNYGDTWDNK